MQALKFSGHTQPAMQTPPKTASEPGEPETASEALKCPKLARPKRLKRTMSVAFPEELDISDKAKEEAAKAEEEVAKAEEEVAKAEEEIAKAEEEIAKAEEVLAETEEVLAKVEEEVAKADEVLAKVAAEAAKAEAAESEEAKAEPATEDAKAEAGSNDVRARAVDWLASLYAHNFVERIMGVLRGKRISPDALVALCDALEDLPQVDIPTSTTPYERAVKHMLMMDKLREAALEARSKAYQAWEKSKWGQAHIDNFAVIDGVAKQEDGTVIQDACAICAVPKSECVKPSEHFGERGESPPDAQCKKCRYNAGNRYDAKYELSLHVDKKHKPAAQAV